MDGRCGTCRCKVLKGHVLESGQESRTPLAGAERVVLACQTVLTGDCTIEISEPDEIVVFPARAIRAKIVALDELNHDVRRLRLRLAKPLAYAPGQYAQLEFAPGLARPYSMAGTGNDTELEFHIRLVVGGRLTGYLAGQARVGDSVRVSGPLGTAYLRRKHTGPMLCIAGNTGLAPILAIVNGARAAGMTNPISLYFGVQSAPDLYGLDGLAALEAQANVRVHCVVARGPAQRQRRSGLLTEAIAKDWREFAGARAYVCGPPTIVEATTLLMTQRGMPREHIHAEAFYPRGT
jgi:ferredoxin-NAD(P)+ reductase (naphthalene dioxygenase ferredoxin-specific)